MSRPKIQLAGGQGTQQRLWQAIRAYAANGLRFTDLDLCTASGDVPVKTARNYRRALQVAGIVALFQGEPQTPKITQPKSAYPLYQLVKDEGIEAPRVRADGSRPTRGLGRENMWRALRLLPGDTNATELQAHASTQAVPLACKTVGGYLRMLYRAGYLTLTRADEGKQRARYRLKPSRNTGPRPPVICRQQVVYDPNEDKIVWQSQVSDEEAIDEA